MLKDKNILIGVTGSIAIYKTLELIRLFIKSNANVRIIMTDESKRFVTPLTFEAISQNGVLHTESESWANDNNHIHIGKWADIFIVAPATANTLNKLANGIADNLLLQSLLAFNKSVILAPSANTNMIEHPSTKESIIKLKEFGYKIAKSQTKLLACNDKGNGAMAEVDEIYHLASKELLSDAFWLNKEVIVTGGGTKEKIDDVRYITNHSSGKMATALSKALYYKGAKVTLISANKTDSLPQEIVFYHTPSSKELEKRIEKHLKTSSYIFMAAAVSDYIPKDSFSGKLKKETLGDEFNLKLIKNRDILKSLDKSNIKSIGFKAEMDEKSALKSAKKMLEEKSLDAVCLNIIKEENSFGSDKNEIIVIKKESIKRLPLQDKLSISFQMLQELEDI